MLRGSLSQVQRRGAALVAVALSLCLAPGLGRAQTTTSLAAAAERSGRYFGTAMRVSSVRDALDVTIADREFDMITPHDALPIAATEPQRGVFNFTQSDEIVGWALAHGKRVRGTQLLWHPGLPSWIGGLSGSTLRSAMLAHVAGVMGHFRGKVAAWDVVDEAFDENGGRRMSLFQATGNDWIEAAFRAARQADPAAKLCYEDYNIENWSWAKTQGVYAMVRDFKARGVPIDCVAFEGHFVGGSVLPNNLQTTLASFAALGVDVALTQVDVTSADPVQYAALTTACMNVPRCVGITVWGIRDGESWRAAEGPLLFTQSGAKKPAYTAVYNALGPTPCCTQPWTLSVTKDGAGTGTVLTMTDAIGIDCGTICSAQFPSGKTVTLVATPDAGATFAGWSGACAGTGACVVTMTADQAVGATFDLAPVTTYPLTVSTAGAGGGTVTDGAGAIACGATCSASLPSGTAVTLTATADAASTFAGWGGACVGTGACVVTMTEARAVTATFTLRSLPCASPVTFAHSTGNFGTTGAACYRTAATVQGWGCANFAGRTVSVNGGAATSTCGAGPFPLGKAADGYTYFSVTAGTWPWASLYTW